MLHLDSKSPSNTHTNTSLLAFKPRQVLLAQRNTRSPMTASSLKEENSSKITYATPELKGNLHQAILDYLHRNGFSKTLKRFQSEAQIQSDAGKASLLHLEDVFCNYNACNVDKNENTNKKAATKDQSDEVTDKKMTESGKNCTQISEEEVIVDEQETKPKKKKTKHDLGSSEELNSDVLKEPEDDSNKKTKKKKKKKDIQEGELEPSTANKNEVIIEDEKKERKKKKKKSKSDSAIEDVQAEPVKKEAESENIQLDASRKDKKSSKKRKRSLSDEHENENVSIMTKISEEPKGQKNVTSKETSDEEANGKVETNGEKPGDQKSTKRQRKDSNEPTTVAAFQRVKIDQVEFAHEKLQDNSYWAKDGADIGYGAKAQEVLGQVRGRDFRHEKTKKKRGSYRGGLIDLQSHSIKFNYADED